MKAAAPPNPPANLPALRHGRADVGGGVHLHYVEQGEGPPVVLLHGFPEAWFSWRLQLPALAAAGFRAIAPDLRGYNESDRPSSGYDIDTLAADVVRLFEAVGAKKPVLVGHDWGGPIAWHVAAMHPESISRLAILNGPHPDAMLRALEKDPGQRKRSWYMLFFQIPFLPERALMHRDAMVMEKMFPGTACDPSRFPPEVVRPYRDAIQRPGAARAMLAYYRTSFRQVLRQRLTGTRRRYPQVECPTLIVWAEEDKALGRSVLDAHEGVARNVTVKTIPHCGHFVQQERPDEVNQALLDFLR
jgi:pimeloyl-ACP methyl ester carboxylesterase